jgi:hypothetical protein
MPRGSGLRLHEEVLLLALKDQKGTLEPGTMIRYAIGGAVLAELMLEGRIAVETVKRRSYARLLTPRPTGDPILDECLGRIRDAKRRADLRTWVSRFASLRELTHRVARELCRRGVLRADEETILLLFKRRVYPELNPVPERELRTRLESAILADSPDLDSRTVVLVSIAKSAGLLKFLLDRKRLKDRKRRIEQIVAGELTGKATKEAIEAMRAAVTVAAILPAILATTTASH